MQNEKKGEIEMKCNLWDVNQENTCGYCVHARVLIDDNKVICKKKNNIFSFSDTCKKFTFDILKKNRYNMIMRIKMQEVLKESD